MYLINVSYFISGCISFFLVFFFQLLDLFMLCVHVFYGKGWERERWGDLLKLV